MKSNIIMQSLATGECQSVLDRIHHSELMVPTPVARMSRTENLPLGAFSTQTRKETYALSFEVVGCGWTG